MTLPAITLRLAKTIPEFLGCLFLGAGLFLSSQVTAQRVKIDSLKNALTLLHDSARVDDLNTLALMYVYLNMDTAGVYAEKASKEAGGLAYHGGQVDAANNVARIAGWAQGDFPLQEKICLRIIKDFGTKVDPRRLKETYMNLALSLFAKAGLPQRRVHPERRWSFVWRPAIPPDGPKAWA